MEITREGEEPRVVLFDPKYKLRSEPPDAEASEEDVEDLVVPTGQPKKLDIARMHAYRGAIRDRQEQRVVEYAAILYPGPEELYVDGIEALSARPNRRRP